MGGQHTPLAPTLASGRRAQGASSCAVTCTPPSHLVSHPAHPSYLSLLPGCACLCSWPTALGGTERHVLLAASFHILPPSLRSDADAPPRVLPLGLREQGCRVRFAEWRTVQGIARGDHEGHCHRRSRKRKSYKKQIGATAHVSRSRCRTVGSNAQHVDKQQRSGQRRGGRSSGRRHGEWNALPGSNLPSFRTFKTEPRLGNSRRPSVTAHTAVCPRPAPGGRRA